MDDTLKLSGGLLTEDGTPPTTPLPETAPGPGGPAANRKGRQDAIVVAARFRPMNSQEAGHGSAEAATVHEDGKGVTVVHGQDKQEHTFTFDRCFGPGSAQSDVYDATGRPIVEDVLEGYYGTVFAYGQTGSGKTYTMEGQQVRSG